jgi:Protein of unknown function (DUF2841)
VFGSDVLGELYGVESESRYDPLHSSDGSDSSSSHGSDSKRKRLEADDSVSSFFKERRRRRKSSSENIKYETLSRRNSSHELNSDKQPVKTVNLLSIADEDAVHEFIVRRFKDLQQNLCKAIAKPWIKMINPNKQTLNPYAGGTATAPWWWPERPPAGTVPTLKNGFVRHKEPDHLKIQGMS